MNKYEKEVESSLLDSEEAVLKQLEKAYKVALDDIDEKIAALKGRDDADMQHVIYQIEYQKALKIQIETILEQLHTNEFETISEYLIKCYEDGFIGTMYDIAGQGIPLILPIDQEAVTIAILTDSKLSDDLYTALGVDINDLKKSISAEISRGIASGLSYSEIAQNLRSYSKIGYNNAMRIVRTEGHRVQQTSRYNAQREAKKKGADILKQWDATLDGRTRVTHRMLDGQIRPIDEPFEANGLEAMYPGGFGDASEDCNCRCITLTRARWGLDADELKTLQDRAEYFGLDKTESFEEYKKKYLKATKK